MFTIIDLEAIKTAERELSHLSRTLPLPTAKFCFDASTKLTAAIIALEIYEAKGLVQ